MLRFSGAGVSDVGLVREHNEDSAFVAPYVALVADGVGGAAAGEVASATAAYVASAVALSRFGDDLERVIRDAVAAARESIRQGIEQDAGRDGHGHHADDGASATASGSCSVTWATRVPTATATARSPRSRRTTPTSSTLVDAGLARPEDLAVHPWRNVVLRSVHGAPDADLTDIDIVDVEVQPGDRLPALQ